MDSIFKGDLSTGRGRLLAWVDALLVDHAILRLGFANFATVAPGKLYRSNHPTPGRLARLSRRYGLKTVINLRGKTGNGSDALTREMATRLGLGFIDMPISSRSAPPRDRILRLHAVLIGMPGPALIHCKSGSDRAGFAAALYVLFQGGNVEAARRQLSLRYGHLARSRAGVLDAFFLRYQREAEGRKSFIDWVREEYDEDALGRDFHAGGLTSFINDKVLARE
jgi:protein tyrosine/serine phosphatase